MLVQNRSDAVVILDATAGSIDNPSPVQGTTLEALLPFVGH
ncbi:MAG: hypothetical protein JWL71_608 [Acidobacteria bacterium]|nr:hypothetical protein [Acidobacteriota bacterium]